MKITGATPYLTSDVGSSAVFLKIETDAGNTGYGEATNHFLPESSLAMLKDLTPYLIGEAPWVNGSGETDVVGPYPEVVSDYALPLEGPGLGVTFDEALAVWKAFRPSLQPRLNGIDGSVRDF